MTLNPTTRNSLLISIRDAENREAWVEFVEIYEPVIYRLLRSSGLQDADARDLTQEVFLKINQHIPNWQPGSDRGSFRGWLRRVTSNLVISWWRKREREPWRKSLWDPQVVADQWCSADASCDNFDRELARATFRYAASLVKHEVAGTTWQAFWETAVENKSIAEVAASLGVSQGSVALPDETEPNVAFRAFASVFLANTDRFYQRIA